MRQRLQRQIGGEDAGHRADQGGRPAAPGLQRVRGAGDALFVNDHGRRPSYVTIYALFLRIGRETGICGLPGEKGPRLHDLRHTLATMLFDAGASANDVQAVLGHSSMQMTERYSRARSDVARRAAAAGVTTLRVLCLGYGFYAYGMVIIQAINGAGDTRTPIYLNLICFWLVEIPVAYLLALALEWGPLGVFAAVPIGESLLAILGILVFRRGNWKLTSV